jgi:hypothetical protein
MKDRDNAAKKISSAALRMFLERRQGINTPFLPSAGKAWPPVPLMPPQAHKAQSVPSTTPFLRDSKTRLGFAPFRHLFQMGRLVFYGTPL